MEESGSKVEVLKDIPEPRVVPYDPSPHRERFRGVLAMAFSLLLIVLVLLPIVLIAIDVINWEDIEGLMTLVFGSVVGIVGTVVGFYYGTLAGGDPG